MSLFIKKRFVFFVLLLIVLSVSVNAFDVWQYPEAADRNSVFVGVFAAFFAYELSDPPSTEFSFDWPEFYIDFILPVGLPFSFGASLDSLRTDMYGIGLRPGYHVNFDVPNLDVYAMYTTNFEISKQRMVVYHGVRLGLRYTFFDFLCLTVESGYNFSSLIFGLSFKLN